MKPVGVIPVHEITSVIRSAFGQSIKVVTDTQPFYLLGDFNGDTFADIAVLVNPDEGKTDLKQHHVKYIDVDPSSPKGYKEAPPLLTGDAIYLDLEREGKAIVYWTGKTYRGYGQ